MIKSFSHKGLEAFFLYGSTKGIQATHSNRIGIILDRLNASEYAEDMNLPGLRFHKYKGQKKNEREKYSVDVSGNWRIVFEFENGNVYIVDYIDPH